MAGPRRRPEDTLTRTHASAALITLIAIVAALLGATAGSSAPPAETTSRVIVQATDAASAKRPAGSVGGPATDDRGIIRAVGARPKAAQRDRLAGLEGVLHTRGDHR